MEVCKTLFSSADRLNVDIIRTNARRLMRIYKNNPITQSIALGIQTETTAQNELHEIALEEPREIDDGIVQEFNQMLHVYASRSCFICDRLMFPYGIVTSQLKPRTIEKICLLQPDIEIEDGPKPLCSRCCSQNKNGNISSQAKWNKMMVESTPSALKNLSSIESSLVSLVKPFMRIFHLSNGRGQYGLRGGVVHFAQAVEEIHQQLPLNAADAGIIVVKQQIQLQAGELNSHISVRPSALRDALQWLVENNPLYNHIRLNEDMNVDISNVVVEEQNNENPSYRITNSLVSYSDLNATTAILRGGLHQGSRIFALSSRGMQCTAMAATAIAYGCIQSPASWTSNTLDEIIIKGDSYFQQQNQLRPLELQHMYMNANEVSGVVSDIFGSLQVSVAVVEDETISGMLNKYQQPNESPLKLHQALDLFLQSEYTNGILTTASFSMGVIKQSQHLYLFDSHSRGNKGGVAANGSACVIRYAGQEKTKQLSAIVHKNVQPKCNPNSLSFAEAINAFAFTITPITTTVVNNEEIVSRDPIPCTQNPVASISQNDLIPKHGQHDISTCLLHSIEFSEPELPEITTAPRSSYFLKRKTTKPLSFREEQRLEELSFVNKFPHGHFGRMETRQNAQTTFEYFQQRVMSADSRFSDHSYLFYALCEIEEEQIRQKINVCCSMKQQIQTENWQYNPQNFHLVLSAIRGTSSYWSAYCSSVLAMVKQLGSPSFFLTFSYDDLNSFDSINALFKNKFGFHVQDIEPNTLSYEEKKDLLDNDPVTAARHFNHRVHCVFKILKKYGVHIFGYPLTDYTWRVEFQNRGSGHIHSLLWLQGAPKLNDDGFISFPDANITCSLENQIKDLVQKYQTHSHSKSCFKKNNTTCRFNYPHPVNAQTRVLTEDEMQSNKGRFIKLRSNTNEAYINGYHPMLLQIFRSNMDIQIVTNEMSVAYYICKYISKAEPDQIRKSLQDVISSAEHVQDPNPRKMLYEQTKKVMRLRELGSQEASYRVCRLPLHFSTRATVFIPAFLPSNRTRMINKYTITSRNPSFCLNIIDKYMLRPHLPEFQDMCLYEFASMYQFISKKDPSNNDDDHEEEAVVDPTNLRPKLSLLQNKGFIQLRLKPAVVRFRHFNSLRQTENYYYSLLLLYLPFREESFLEGHSSAAQAFNNLHTQLRTSQHNSIIQLEFQQELNRCLLLLAEQIADAPDDDDLNVDVFEDNDNDDDETVPVQQQISFNLDDHLDSIQTLSEEQKKVFTTITSALTDGVPKRLIALGSGGVGKSHLIKIIHNHVQCLTYEGISNSIILACPTGVAAKNINGCTLHKAFKLPVEKHRAVHHKPLRGKYLQDLRNTLRNLKIVIIDEFSMMSYQVFRAVHLRLQEAFNNQELFGGVTVLLVGDLLQLKPVQGNWIFVRPDCFRTEIDLWREFKFQELHVNFRQRNDPLLSVCNALREGKIEANHVELLLTRVLDSTRSNYVQMHEEFKGALHIFPTHKLVDKFNALRAIELSKTTEVHKIVAVDTYGDGNLMGNPAQSKHIPQKRKDTAGIPSVLNLGLGSRVMLLRNKDVKRGLVNGSMGKIIGFKWQGLRSNARENSNEVPFAVNIQFDDILENSGISEIRAEEFSFPGKRATTITRFMLPLVECYATNVHKVQSLSLNKAVVDLGNKHFAKGSEYVALSRVRTLNGLAVINLDTNRLLQNRANPEAMKEITRLRNVQLSLTENIVDSEAVIDINN